MASKGLVGMRLIVRVREGLTTIGQLHHRKITSTKT